MCQVDKFGGGFLGAIVIGVKKKVYEEKKRKKKKNQKGGQRVNM